MTFSKLINNKDELARIVDFPCKDIMFNYLGIPITSKTLTYNECSTLVTIFKISSSNGVARSSHTVAVHSYVSGKLQYILQISILLTSVINKIKSITYNFIWGSQQEVAWANMIYPKPKGAWVYTTSVISKLQ